MQFMSREEVEKLRQEYPVGTIIKLIRMDDPYTKILSGTFGAVRGVDDAGHILMSWETGSTLSLIVGEDDYVKATEQEILEHASKLSLEEELEK